MTARVARHACALLVVWSMHATSSFAQNPPPAPQVRIVPTDGHPGDSVTLGQTFEIKASMPGANPPPTVTVRLTTPSGSTKDVTLHRIGTENGVATYGTGTVESIGGTRNARLVASNVHRTTGTINDLELSNGEMVTAQLVGANGSVQTGGSASIPVYDDDIQQGIARNREMLDAIGESLVLQRNQANAVMTDANAPADVRQQAQQVRDEADAKLRELGQSRQAIERLQTPLAKLRMGNKAVTGLTRTDEAVDLTGPITDRDVIQDNMISIATAATLSTYKILSDLTMSGAFYKAGQGFVSFAMNEFWMNKFFGPKLQGLRDRMAGPAIDEFGRTITGADQRAAVGEIVLGFFLMAKFPKFMDWLSDGRPADIRIPGGGRPTPAAPRAPTTPAQPGAVPKPATTRNPLRPLTTEEQLAFEADELAEVLARYDGNLKAAREAGVSESRIREITSKGQHGDPDVADALGREALKAQGKQIDMPVGEYSSAKLFETRNRLRTLTEDDYNWLRNKLAEDPQYLDNLTNRGRMSDDFDPAITPAQRDELLQNPRVRTMVDEAKAKAAEADATGTQRLPATNQDATPTVRLPATGQDATPTVRLPATGADATPTVKLPATGQVGGRPQTGVVDPNATQRTGPPTATTNPDATPTVKIPPPTTDPGATTIITPTTGGATQRMGPPTATTNPDATPTVKIPPPTTDPGATTIITPTTGGATQRMGPPTATTNPDATPTVKIPPPTTDPGATTIITRPTTGGATQRMGPPTATTNPDATPTVKIPPPTTDPGATTIITPTTGGATQRMGSPTANTNPDATPTVKIPPPTTDPGATAIITRPTTGGGTGSGTAGAKPPAGGTGAAEPTTIGVVPGGFTPAPSVPPIDFHIMPGDNNEADDRNVTGGFKGTVIDLTNGTDGIGVISNWGGGRNPTVQLMIIDSALIEAPPGGSMIRRAPAAAAPRFGLRDAWIALRRFVTAEPSAVSLSAGPHWIRERTSAPPARINAPRQRNGQPQPAVKMFLSSLGVSTGEAFEARVVNEGDVPVQLTGDGLVVEPLDPRGQNAAKSELQKAASKNPAASMLNAYCLEFLRQPPTAGTLFRIASPELQQRFAPVRKVLQAARKLQEAGLLKPDSNPAEYFHSIKQWALWSREQKFDLQSFGKAFVEHAKKNFNSAGRQWTRQIEEAVMGVVPGRWRDIAQVLAAAEGAAQPEAAGLGR